MMATTLFSPALWPQTNTFAQILTAISPPLSICALLSSCPSLPILTYVLSPPVSNCLLKTLHSLPPSPPSDTPVSNSLATDSSLSATSPTLTSYLPQRDETAAQNPFVALFYRISAALSFGPYKLSKSFHVFSVGCNAPSYRSIVQASRLLSLLRFSQHSSISLKNTPKQSASVQILDVVPPSDNVYRLLNCIIPKPAADDSHNHTANPVPISILSDSIIFFS